MNYWGLARVMPWDVVWFGVSSRATRVQTLHKSMIFVKPVLSAHVHVGFPQLQGLIQQTPEQAAAVLIVQLLPLFILAPVGAVFAEGGTRYNGGIQGTAGAYRLCPLLSVVDLRQTVSDTCYSMLISRTLGGVPSI